VAEGVLAVVTGRDLARATRPFPNRLPFLRPVDYHALAIDRVRFVGEPVAAVVGESPYLAEDALEQIQVEYEPLPVVADLEQAQVPGAPRLYEEWPDNLLTRRTFSVGDVDGAFAAAEVVIRETFTSNRQAPLPIELRGCLATYDGQSLTVWSSTQVPHVLRSTLAEALQVPESSIRVIAPDVGGGFGLKYQIFREEVLVAQLARLVDRPVKWREDLREHLTSAIHARDQRVHLELAARGDGVVTAIRAEVEGDVGSGAAYPPSYGPVMVLSTTFPLGLRVQNFSYDFRCVVTNKCPAGAYRGFGNPVRVFAVERALDLLAARLGLDPAEVRRRNLLTRADLPYRAASGARLNSGTFCEAMERALELVDYSGFRAVQQEARCNGRYLGLGIGAFAEASAPSLSGLAGTLGGYDSCTIRLEPDGRATALVGISPQGQGHETVIAQVVADELGLAPDEVTVRHSDTAVAPYGLGAWASRGAVVGGGAAIQAAEQVREKLLQIGAHLLEADPGDLRLSEGRLALADLPSRSVSLREVAEAAYAGRGRLPAGLTPGLEATAFFEPAAIEATPDAQGRVMRYATVSNACHIAIVEVVPETGEVELLDYVVVHDCGTIINPMIVEGQVHGGVAQGLAGALYEQVVYDEQGQLLTGSLLDYPVPTAREIPTIRTDHLESPDPTLPGGFKGMGEGGTIGAPAAVANAIADALAPLGVEVTRTPLGPPEVARLIREARARRA
jgi:aerobic carbon-monoxide dehydrogenase large subunit